MNLKNPHSRKMTVTDLVSTKFSQAIPDLIRKWSLPFLCVIMEQKVYLIVQDKPVCKVFARVFGSQEKAEKAMNERDENSGEKLYTDCHIIERTIE